MKRFVLDCRFDGDTAAIVAKVIPPIVASSMLAEAGETILFGENALKLWTNDICWLKL